MNIGNLRRLGIGAAFTLFAISSAQAQNRFTVPAGTVILVHTESPIESSTARTGQTFETIVDDTLGVENYTVIPSGSRIRGTITYVRPATRQQSGVIEVDFNRLTLSDGTVVPIQGRLTSTSAEERRQIESSSNQRVVLVGGRGGIGAAIAGAGSQNSSTSGILGALGALLSEGQNVSVPSGTQLAVQLEQAVSLRGRGSRRNGGATLYTSTAMIRAAQSALAQQNYYRGTIDGQLTYATQRALFEYQTDKGLTATGNLDWRTAQALGLSGVGGIGGNGGVGGSALTVENASTLRRNAQSIVGVERQNLSLGNLGRLNSSYTDADIDLWFALSAFADNASLYEQLVRSSNSGDAYMANRSLITAARRVDAALQASRASTSVRNAWQTIRSQLTSLDSTYY